MARLSLLLPPWETCSPRIDEPERRVTGASPAWEASWAPVPGGLAQGLGQQGRRRPGPLIPGTCGQDLVHERGPPARVTGLGGDIGPLSAWGDELPGQVG